MAMPLRVAMKTRSEPVLSLAEMSSSSSVLRPMAMMPRESGLSNSASSHFLMTPHLVAMTTNWSGVNSLTGRKALMVSSSCSEMSWLMFLPLLAEPASGML